MKLLNLIPEEEKKKALVKKVKTYVYISLLIPISLFGYMKYSTIAIENSIEDANDNIMQSQRLEASISNLGKDIDNLSNTLGNLKQESMPLHYFLLFLGESVPGDIKVHSVISETVVLDREDKGLTSEGEDPKEVSKNNNSIVVVDNSSASDSTDQNNQNSSSNTNSGSNPKEENSQEGETGQNDSIELEKNDNFFEVELDNKNIIIRGSALSVKSIGDFIFALEGTEYIERVDIKYVRNYYNGIDNYKLFELKAIVKVEEN